MKKILLFGTLTILTMTTLVGCNPKDQEECHIHGVMPNNQYDTRWIFLVPLNNANNTTVDSVQIENSMFDFVTNKNQMAIIRVDFRYRYGLQDLLVVTEPGNVKVKIGAKSEGRGTPQNDSLNIWKNVTEMHNKEYGRMMHNLSLIKDTTIAKSLKTDADNFHLKYKRFTRRLADNMKDGALHDFLKNLYPTSYKKRSPDGKITTINEE